MIQRALILWGCTLFVAFAAHAHKKPKPKPKPKQHGVVQVMKGSPKLGPVAQVDLPSAHRQPPRSCGEKCNVDLDDCTTLCLAYQKTHVKSCDQTCYATHNSCRRACSAPTQ